jgi:hypothetical protein
MKKYTPYEEAEINKFLDAAEIRADRELKIVHGLDVDSRKALWNYTFHKAMDEMTSTVGLRQHRSDKWN